MYPKCACSGRVMASASFLILTAVIAPRASAQSVNAQSPPSQTITEQASLPAQYQWFFAYQLRLDGLAAALQAQGKNGASYGNYLESAVGFSDAQYALVRATAVKLKTELAVIDAQIKAAADSTLATTAKHSGLWQWSSASPELTQLKTQRDSLIRSEVGALRISLGPTQAAKLDAFVQAEHEHNLMRTKSSLPSLNGVSISGAVGK